VSYLRGERIRLYKFTDRYITPQYIEWLNDHSINKYLCVGRTPIAMEDVTAPRGQNEMRFAILSNIGADPGDNIFEDHDFVHYIGTASFSSIDWISRRAEIGYLIGEKTHWGLGIATETIKLLSEYGFGRLGMHKIEAGVVDGNTGSSRALEKNGFTKYGSAPEDHYLDGKFLDTHRFYKIGDSDGRDGT